MGLLDQLKNDVSAVQSALQGNPVGALEQALGLPQGGIGQSGLGPLPPELQALLGGGQASGGNNVLPFNLANLAQLMF